MLLLVSDSGEMTKIMVLYANKTELLCNLNGVLSHLSDGSPSQFPTQFLKKKQEQKICFVPNLLNSGQISGNVQNKMNLRVILQTFHLKLLCLGIFFPNWSFAYILWFLILCFDEMFLNPRITRKKDKIHDCLIKPSCNFGCTRKWLSISS